MTAGGRLKLDKDNGPARQCILREDSRGELRARSALMEAYPGARVADNERAYDRKHLDRMSEKGFAGSFQYGLIHKPTTIQEAFEEY